ncbi:MAG TPA: glycosyltransferase [Gemmatimonadaceae bacterium]
MIECTVVIPTYRRADLLERCLEALTHQSLPAHEYEVVVVDDARSDATRAQVERLRDRGGAVRYLRPEGDTRGPAAARNAGWRGARGWLIAFTDDDTVPDAEWLSAALSAFTSGERRLDAAWGRIEVPLPERPTDYERDAAGLERAGFVTANCFARRDVLEALGGFDERFTSAWREDSDLYFRLLGAGRHVEHLGEALVVHPVRPASWGVSVRQQRKAAFDALLYKKHPALFVEHVRPARPALYYPAVLALCVACVGAATGAVSIAAGGWAAWAALTGAFAARRLRGTSRAPRHVAEMAVTSAVIPPLSLFWRVRGAVQHRVLFW